MLEKVPPLLRDCQKVSNSVGRFIAIEGGDGSGKATQSKLLAEYARHQGFDVLEITFPRYGQDSAYYVEQYLNGRYGEANDVPAELGTLPFALDRYAAKNDIEAHLDRPNSLVISDRYMASNLAHQGTKIPEPSTRHEFYRRTLLTEYDILGIPRPDLNIVLLVPSAISQINVDKKSARSYTEKKRDIHEADTDHLEKAKRNYEELVNLYPDEFTSVQCIDNQKLRTIEDIQTQLRSLLKLQ